VTISAAEVDNLLVTRAQQGDREAFRKIVQRHHRPVIALIYRMFGDASLAEDAAQETFIQAWIHLPGYQSRSRLHSWLYRIAVNTAVDMLRRERKMLDVDQEKLAIQDNLPGPEASLIQKESTDVIQQAILELSDSNRAVLVMREYGGLSYQEIATALDIPMGTVMSRLNYSRTQLRISLEPQLEKMEIKHG
jgi:RNA polymerase sigma-70 factor (ECF subfamily)